MTREARFNSAPRRVCPYVRLTTDNLLDHDEYELLDTAMKTSRWSRRVAFLSLLEKGYDK
jgi:hypothetical protein